MAVVTPFRASHLAGIALIPEARVFEAYPSETLWHASGQVIACYGCVLLGGRGILWLVPGPQAYTGRRALLRALFLGLTRVTRHYGLWRLEVTVDPCNHAAVRLVECLGLTFEVRLYGFGADGLPRDQYVWIREKERVYDR